MTERNIAPWSWRSTTALLGLALGVLGILLQFIRNPALFGGGFPPGIYFLVGAAVLVLLTRRWSWAPIFAVLIAAWVTFGGVVGGQLGKNISSGNLAVAVGAVLLQLGLAVAVIVGVMAIVQNVTNKSRRRASVQSA